MNQPTQPVLYATPIAPWPIGETHVPCQNCAALVHRCDRGLIKHDRCYEECTQENIAAKMIANDEIVEAEVEDDVQVVEQWVVVNADGRGYVGLHVVDSLDAAAAWANEARADAHLKRIAERAESLGTDLGLHLLKCTITTTTSPWTLPA